MGVSKQRQKDGNAEGKTDVKEESLEGIVFFAFCIPLTSVHTTIKFEANCD